MSAHSHTEKHEVLAFGRFNPPTSGHERVVNKVHEVAAKNRASHKVILSYRQDKDNPLPQDKKFAHAQVAFPATNLVVKLGLSVKSVFFPIKMACSSERI